MPKNTQNIIQSFNGFEPIHSRTHSRWPTFLDQEESHPDALLHRWRNAHVQWMLLVHAHCCMTSGHCDYYMNSHEVWKWRPDILTVCTLTLHLIGLARAEPYPMPSIQGCKKSWFLARNHDFLKSWYLSDFWNLWNLWNLHFFFSSSWYKAKSRQKNSTTSVYQFSEL